MFGIWPCNVQNLPTFFPRKWKVIFLAECYGHIIGRKGVNILILTCSNYTFVYLYSRKLAPLELSKVHLWTPTYFRNLKRTEIQDRFSGTTKQLHCIPISTLTMAEITKDSGDMKETTGNTKSCLTKAGTNPRQKPLMRIKNVSKIHTMAERKEVQSK